LRIQADGPFVKFDHDFIGRAALEKMAAAGNHRTKVTLALDNEDVMRVQSSALSQGERAKFMEYPSSVYSMHPFDSCAERRQAGRPFHLDRLHCRMRASSSRSP